MNILKIFGWVLLNAIIGTFLIFVLNIFSLDFLPEIGVNALTIVTSAVLGIPGVFMLYGLKFFI